MPVIALCVMVLAALVSTQITFSRDWSGGKRAAAAPQLAVDCEQFARLCRHFIHELKSSMAGEVAGASGKHRRTSGETPSLYDDE
ncbi:uncharacterized protein LOC113231155 [Hyposmocoma kahamanoa]|uniref:uncharacterized protein LOC113231155 n=1 Tax=Hyposmocoma kahamanoa TaxID=1477025 RepID=UPI000E6D7A63|nr:uncharacterized protein LOC113231155 [Hyposmocoma kahamanoa]